MGSQAVLQRNSDDYFHISVIPDVTALYAPKPSTRFWKHSLLYPSYVAALSAIILIVQFTLRISFVKRWVARIRGAPPVDADEYEAVEQRPSAATSNMSAGFLTEIKEYIRLQGGPVICAFGVMKLLSCLALVGLTIYAVIITPGPGEPKTTEFFEQDSDVYTEGKKKKKHRKNQLFSTAEWHEIALCAFYTYASLLALLSLSTRPRVRRLLSAHLSTILLFAFGVFAYRDLFPLATYTLKPKDGHNGWLTWTRIGILTFAGIVIPLCVPQVYTPLDPKNPVPPNPEQTASLLSFVSFSFLDSVILQSRKNPHLPYEDLPPLADYDHADHLVKRSFHTLDPAVKPTKERHFFWGLLSVFRVEYTKLVLIVIAKAFISLSGPIATNRLLYYLESKGKDAVIRPWVWALALFVSQLGGSIAIQWYIWIATRMMIHTEAIITQLVFEHSLKIRLAEDVSSSGSSPGSKSASTSIPQTPERRASTREETGSEGSGASDEAGPATTVVGSESQSPATKGKAKDVPKPTSPPSSDSGKGPKPEGHGANLVGKINNLVSTDLGNITDGRDFLIVILLSPLLLGLCIWFLYSILGWSAFVGLAVMLISIPLPGWVVKLVQGLQVERMKKTDGRVQAITETMSVLRMIKLFGWEKKVRAQIATKREEELHYIRNTSLLNLANMNINWVLPLLTMIATFATYTELLDRYATGKEVTIDAMPPTADRIAIGFSNATFSWHSTNGSTPGSGQTPSRRNFQLRIEGDLLFKKNKINLIIGPTGCGKTSLLMALLGEMHFKPEAVDSWFNLPRDGGVAYAAQESWVQNATIKDNILFGAPFDEERYKKVLNQCALERDLTLFEGGDLTEVGEKGMTLSGGQKARVTLARAVYSNAQTLLLDDILSALDVHTSRWIVDKCLRGDLLKDRTVLLVVSSEDFVICLLALT
ncbi:hypothetical protein FRC03_007393 [Tulasnella sp. 419]|nr:hypothetical protein FRC03_007393 [Tulasnella sp. 419]